MEDNKLLPIIHVRPISRNLLLLFIYNEIGISVIVLSSRKCVIVSYRNPKNEIKKHQQLGEGFPRDGLRQWQQRRRRCDDSDGCNGDGGGGSGGCCWWTTRNDDRVGAPLTPGISRR